MDHVIIIPARNEAAFIEQTLTSLMEQTRAPDRVLVVDDGSEDATAAIVDAFAGRHPSVSLLRGAKFAERRYKVVDVFNQAYDEVKAQDFAYVSKIDADQLFPKDYFETLLGIMDADPSIAVGCGTLYETINGKLEPWRTPPNHVPGALKTYRKSVFDEIGGFIPILGWDIIDLVKVRSLGYRNIALADLKVIHRRRHASAGGILKGNVRMGRGAYAIGSHPLFALGRSVYRMLEPPYILAGLAFGYGYLKSWIARGEQIADRDLIAALRSEQLYRLAHRNRLPEAQP